MRNVDHLLSAAIYARDRVNPYLFNYCFSVALLHRSDTQDLDVPSFIRSFPDKYVDSKVFAKAREEATVVPEGSRVRNFSFNYNISNTLIFLILSSARLFYY